METGVEKKVNLNALVGLILMMIVYPRRGGPHSEILGQPVGREASFTPSPEFQKLM